MPLTISEILKDEALRRHEFPVSARQTFLAHAGVSPLPRRVVEAIGAYAQAGSIDDQEEALEPGLVGQVRRLAAGLIGADHDEVSLVGPTSLALSQVAAGLQMKRGQNVLIYHDCYPSNVYPWMALADRGVEVRLMNIRELGKIRVVDVQGQIDEDTRLVAIASAHYLTGWRINIDAIGRMLRSKGFSSAWMRSRLWVPFQPPWPTSIFWRRTPTSGCWDRARRDSCTFVRRLVRKFDRWFTVGTICSAQIISRKTTWSFTRGPDATRPGRTIFLGSMD